MADGQISFYSTADVDNLNVPEGAVIISKRDEEKHLADLFAMLGGDRYQLKPSYDWDEIENTPNIEEYVDQQVTAAGLKILSRYFSIDYTSAEDSSDGEVELKIYANEDPSADL